MIEGIVGVYPNAQGVIYANFRAGDKGLPLELFLPNSAQGAGFDDFPIAGYFNYARIWLGTPEQWADFGIDAKLEFALQQESRPVNMRAPNIDLLAYGIQYDDGTLDNAKLVKIFAVIGRLWDHQPLISPQVGLFFDLVQVGMSLDDIFQHIVDKAEQGTPNAQGVLQLDAVQTSPNFQKTVAQKIQNTVDKTTLAKAKKNRKQGRVNRKRGRK